MTDLDAEGDLERQGDTPKMIQAIRWLRENRIPVTRPATIQLKIGCLNYYAASGTICFDGSKRELERGLPGLKAILERGLGRSLLPIDETVAVLPFETPARRL